MPKNSLIIDDIDEINENDETDVSVPSEVVSNELRLLSTDRFWSYGFSYSVLDQVYESLAGQGATFTEISSMATDGTKASSFSSSFNMIYFLGYYWEIVYLSMDKNNNVIMTLWLNNGSGYVTNSDYYSYGTCTGSVYCTPGSSNYFKIENSIFGFTYRRGTAYCMLGYSSSAGEYGILSADYYSIPNNLYKLSTPGGNSDFASYTRVFVDVDTEEPTGSYVQKFTNIVNLASYSNYSSVLPFLVKPRDVAWQEVQSAKEILGMSYNLSNESWSTTLSDDGFYSSKNNYAHISGSDDWADEYFWLPSLSEIGYSGTNGLWGVSKNLRMCLDTDESIIGYRRVAGYPSTWTRSANYKQSYGYYFIKSSGEGMGIGITSARAYRPCVHLNLTAIEAKR